MDSDQGAVDRHARVVGDMRPAPMNPYGPDFAVFCTPHGQEPREVDVPGEIVEAAIRIGRWFAEQGIVEWQMGALQNRRRT